MSLRPTEPGAPPRRRVSRVLRCVVLVAALVASSLPALLRPAPARAAEILVSAAASLTAAFEALAAAHEKTHPDVDVQTNFAGSPTLVHQILEGAPADVFASADPANMQRLVAAGSVAGTPRVFARNRLEIVVERGNPEKIATLADLARPGLVVALCGPAVPAGRYAREAFAKAAVAVPRSSEELDVKAVVARVALGEADAGVVYETDVHAAGEAVDGVPIPEATNVVAEYPIAVLKEARDRAAAEAFVALVLGPEGRAILARHGFLAP